MRLSLRLSKRMPRGERMQRVRMRYPAVFKIYFPPDVGVNCNVAVTTNHPFPAYDSNAFRYSRPQSFREDMRRRSSVLLGRERTVSVFDGVHPSSGISLRETKGGTGESFCRCYSAFTLRPGEGGENP